MDLTKEQLQEDVAYLLARAACASSVTFGGEDKRWTGVSSNAIIALAYGGEQKAMPWDWSDYAACLRAVRRLPRHRQTPVVRAALRKARAAVDWTIEDRRTRFHERRAKAKAA